jgi:hypothetical protein
MENITNQNQRVLPNASTVLVLGILSIVLGCGGVGLILGIIGLIISKEGKRLYEQSPGEWSGYSNLNAGRIMSIIGICVGGLAIIYYVIWGLVFGAIIGAAGGWGNLFNQ